jgi:hypothetical protein
MGVPETGAATISAELETVLRCFHFDLFYI